MSKGRQAAGEPPAKVVVADVRGSRTPNSQAIYEQQQGEIERFYQACRQAVTLSGVSGLQRFRALEGGGQVRYTYNHGQEHLTVVVPEKATLSPPARVNEESEDQDKESPPDVVLAIDILFEHVDYLAADVYWTHKTIYVPEVPGIPGDPFPPRSSWTPIFDGSSPGEPGSSPDNPLDDEITSPPPNPFNFRFGPSSYYRALGSLEWYEPPGGAQSYLASGIGVALLSTVSTVSGGSINETDFNLVYGYPLTDDLVGTQIRVTMSWRVPGADIGVPPTPEVAATFQFHKTVRLFDTLLVAGARVTPPDDPDAAPEDLAPYEAVSTQPSTDDRLQALSFYSSSRVVTRSLEIADPQPWITGCGFKVLPVTDVEGATTAIDVYLDTENLRKWNIAPGAADLTVDDDHPSFNYDLLPLVKWKLRVREYADLDPIVIGVSTSSERMTEMYTPPPAPPEINSETGEELPSIYEYMPDTPPTVLQSSVTDASPRTFTWAFLALDSWVDPGGDPTAGSDPALGVLLAESAGTTSAGGVDPLPRELKNQPAWASGATTMTRIATVRWTPATADAPGTAVIEMA